MSPTEWSRVGKAISAWLSHIPDGLVIPVVLWMIGYAAIGLPAHAVAYADDGMFEAGAQHPNALWWGALMMLGPPTILWNSWRLNAGILTARSLRRGGQLERERTREIERELDLEPWHEG